MLQFLLAQRMIKTILSSIFQKWTSKQRDILISEYFTPFVINQENSKKIINLLYCSLEESNFLGVLLDVHSKKQLKHIGNKAIVKCEKKQIQKIKKFKYFNLLKKFETILNSKNQLDNPENLKKLDSIVMLLSLVDYFGSSNCPKSFVSNRIKKEIKAQFSSVFESKILSLCQKNNCLQSLDICYKLALAQHRFKKQMQFFNPGSVLGQVVSCLFNQFGDKLCLQINHIISQISFWKVFSFKYHKLFLKFIQAIGSKDNALEVLSQNLFKNQSMLNSLDFLNNFCKKMKYFTDHEKGSFLNQQGGWNSLVKHILSLEIFNLKTKLSIVLKDFYSSKLKFLEKYISCVLVHNDFWFENLQGLFYFICTSTGSNNALELRQEFLQEVREQVLKLNQMIFENDSGLEGVILDFERGQRFNEKAFTIQRNNLLTCIILHFIFILFLNWKLVL